MGRLVKFAAALLLPLAFVGCSVPVVEDEAPTASQTSTVPAQQASEDTDAKFDYAFAYAFTTEYGFGPTNEVVLKARDAAKAACTALDRGATAEQIVEAMGSETRIGVIVVGVGVGIYCPQYISRFSG